MRSNFVLLMLAAVGCSQPAAAESPVPPAAEAKTLKAGGGAGQQAPDFTVTDHRGQTVSLEALRASGPVLLLFYRGHW